MRGRTGGGENTAGPGGRPSGPAAARATRDARGRLLRDLRISVTDRCNFRCRYCMPREEFGPDHTFLEHQHLLSFDEIERVARAFVQLGVEKIRLTGGEPLMRRRLPELIRRLRAIDDRLDIALTTNGVLLPRMASALAAAGLARVTVSLDALDDIEFREMTDSRFSVSDVLAGVAAAAASGMDVKINCVAKRLPGARDDGQSRIVDIADHFRHTGHTPRFIEYMDVGTTNAWAASEVIPMSRVIATLEERFGVEPLPARYPGEVARRFRYRDGAGEVGVIASVSEPFCGTCSRARLAADGQLFGCLFAPRGTDLRTLVRSGLDVGALVPILEAWWAGRTDRYSELRAAGLAAGPRAEMSYLGG